MKYSEKFFKFPVKCYTGLDWNKVEDDYDKLMEGIDVELIEPEFAKGFEYVLPEEIIGISPTFSIFVDIKDVIRNGFKLSQITLRNGKQVVSNWSPEKFLERLNEFTEKKEA